MKIKWLLKIKLLFLLGFFSTASFCSPLQWQVLAPGLEYTTISTFGGFAGKGIHIFRFDLHSYKLQLAFTKQANRVNNIESLLRDNRAVVGVNGGFFTPDLKPLGLRIDRGQIKNPLKNTSWWGVFFTRNQQAFIVSPTQFKSNNAINFAVQSGPRLIVNNQIPSLKPSYANRTALGVTRDGKIILLATSNFPLGMDELAKLMRAPEAEGGLNCINALNLDGGSSTQLYANVNGFILSVPSFAMVTDAVLVVPQTN